MSVDEVKQRLRHNLLEIGRIIEYANFETAKSLLTASHRNLERIKDQITETLYNAIKTSIEGLDSVCSVHHSHSNVSYAAERLPSGRGRPVVNISVDQLISLQSQGHTAQQMAKHFQCSTSTIFKKCSRANINFRSRYAQISDEELEQEIRKPNEKFPNTGSVLMDGFLKSQGLVVQRHRIRTILNKVDPIGTATRWSMNIKRRVYKVATPNSLWHIDAHLKLVRWGFISHGCIDGFSRTIAYLSCTTSITAATVVKLFVPAVKKYGFPSRVRSDHGYENLFVAILMNAVRGLHRGSHITGRSVHNQRIERLWKDAYTTVIDSFHKLFYAFENDGILNPNSDIHRFVLQKLFLDEINNTLTQFINAWNNHKVRTERNRSPLQIWQDGFLENFNSSSTAILEQFSSDSLVERLNNTFENQYGLDTSVIREPVEDISQYTSRLQLTPDQDSTIEEIKNNTEISLKERYRLMVEYLS